MVRENRIKKITFGVNDLTTTGSNLEVYSEAPINGIIQRIDFEAGNWAATGSLWISISGGTQEQIWYKKGGLDINEIVYPGVFGVNNVNATGSPTSFTQRVVGGDIIQVSASGISTGKSGLGLTINYI